MASSQKQRTAALQAAIINAKINHAYDIGQKDGFERGLVIWLYCTMEVTNWKQNGLLKIWQKCQDVSEALETPETGLIFEDLQLALAAEAGIMPDETFRQKAREALHGQNKPTKDYQAVVAEAIAKYEAITKEMHETREQNDARNEKS